MKAKKIVSVFAASALTLSGLCAFSGCTPRDEVLKIYNWGDYIEESLIGRFESWYKEETGKKITVQYDTFDTNETMLMRIETQKADYDLVCPSDYIAERMIDSKLVKKLDRSIFDIDMQTAFYDGLADMVKPFDPDNEYFVPYVWGTFGIMYDVDHIDPGAEECKTWGALWSREWQKKTGKRRVLMKDSVRDAYSVALIYGNREKLSDLSGGFPENAPYGDAYRNELISYFTDINAETIAAAQKTLIDQKPAVYKYEVDNGKEDMLAGTTDAWLGLFWSCDALLVMIEEGGDHFYYEVPKEGSNVWVDGWLIPKYAQNTTAANYFLKFINTHEFAADNFEWMGSSMSLKSVMDEAKAELEEDEEFFAEYYDGFKEMYIDAMFPPPEVLSRCAVMRDCGIKKSTDLDSMWIDVKTT